MSPDSSGLAGWARHNSRELTIGALLLAIVVSGVMGPTAPVVPAIAALAAGAATLALVGRQHPHRFWSVPTLALAVLCVFHFGALPEYLARGAVFEETGYDWMSASAGPAALWVSIGGVLAFALGVVAVSPRTSLFEADAGDWTASLRFAARRAVGLLDPVAPAVLVVSVGVWFVLTVGVGGLNPWQASYFDYLDAAENIPFVALFQPIGLAFALTAILPAGRTYRVSVAVFVAFGLVAFLVGFRGEVLFPLVAHIGILAYRRRLPPFRWMIALALAGLVLISIGREVRLTGASGFDPDEASVSVLNGITELGFSQFVVESVYTWHHTDGDAFTWGETYVAPVDRLVARVLGAERADGAEDTRLFNVYVDAHEPAIGGSIIGEAYHNGGYAGVVLVLGVWGAMLSLLASRPRSWPRLSVLGIVFFAYLWHVRNAFTPVPLLLGGGLLALAVIMVAGRLVLRRRHER